MPPTGRNISVSWLGQIIWVVFSCLLLTILAWFLWLAMVAIAVYFYGWEYAFQWLNHLLFAIHAPVKINCTVLSFFNGQSLNVYLPKLSNPKLEIVLTNINKAWQLFLLLSQLVFWRCVLFMQGSFIIISLNALGLVDGLVQRDIRKFQGARESTFIFHRSKSLYRFILLMGYFVFLLLPTAFSPKLFLLLLAIVLALLIQNATAYFKKYL